MSAYDQSIDDARRGTRQSGSSGEDADVSTDEAPASLPAMTAINLKDRGPRDGRGIAAAEQSSRMVRSQSNQSKILLSEAAEAEGPVLPSSSQASPRSLYDAGATPAQSSIPEPRQTTVSGSTSPAMEPLDPAIARRPTTGIFAKAASARSTSSSSSLVRERIQSIEALDKRRPSLDLARGVSSGSSSRFSQRRSLLPPAQGDRDEAPPPRSPTTRWSALHRPREKRTDLMASPSRSSATTVRRADEEETITIPKAQPNGFHTPVSASAGSHSHDGASSGHSDENGHAESEMDAEEKVGMWRNSGRLHTERDSGGSASSGKRRTALPREFRTDTQHDNLAANPDTRTSIDTPTRSTRPESLARLENNTLTRSTSLRSSIASPDSRLRRSGGAMEAAEQSRLGSLRLASGSVSNLRREVPASADSDRWEVGSTRTRHSSLMPPSRPRDDISGVLSAVEADREESKARRLALLHSLETESDKTAATPRRSMDTLHRPHMSESRIRPSTSFSLRTVRDGDAPSSAPAMAPAERRVYSSLRISQNSSNGVPDSPLSRLRTSTRISHRATASEASPRLERNALRPPTDPEASISSSGTPSRVVMARLLAAMRSASSHEARLLVEACMTLVERSTDAGMHPAGLFESAHKSVVAVNLVAARLQGAVHAVRQELEEVETASAEEAQAIVMAGHQHLVNVLGDAERDQQDALKQLTLLLEAATIAVADGGRPHDESQTSPFKPREERAATSSPVHHRHEGLRTRLHDRPMSPYRSSTASTAAPADREVRRMSSEIMRPSTSMDTFSPRNRFSTQTRGATRSPVSSRTSGEYFAAEGSTPRRSPFRASTIDGLPEGTNTIYETPDEGAPAVRRSGSIFRRFQRSPLKTATVAAFPCSEPTQPPLPPPRDTDEPRLSLDSTPGTRSRPHSGSISRRGPFLPAMPQRTPTTALSTINATTEGSPEQDFFARRDSGDEAGGRFHRAGTEESAESFRTAEEGAGAGAGAQVSRRGSMGALRKMSSFMKGAK